MVSANADKLISLISESPPAKQTGESWSVLFCKGAGYMDGLPTAEEITKAVINCCKGLPWAVVELNIQEALKDYEELKRWWQEWAAKTK